MPGQLLIRIGALLDEDLDESALFLRMLPGQRLLASGHLDHEVAHTPRFARLHHQVLRQVVTLVQHAQRDHPVLVGRAELLALRGLCRAGLHSRDGIGNAGVLLVRRRLATPTGREQRQGDGKRNIGGGPLHGPCLRRPATRLHNRP